MQKQPFRSFRQNPNQLAKAIADRLSSRKTQEGSKGRLQRASDSLSVFLGLILKLFTVVTILVLVAGIVLQQWRSSDDVVLEDFQVPPELEKIGYKSDVIATRLADRINFISKKTAESVSNNIGASATTRVGGGNGSLTATSFIGVPTFKLTSAESSLDVEVPQTRATVGSLFRYLFESFGFQPTRIDGEIIGYDGRLVFTIRITDHHGTRVLGVLEEDAKNPEGLLTKGAEAIYKDIRPVVLAWYLYGTQPAKIEDAKALIQDCIYQNKEAALANVLWIVILLNEGDHEGALAKIRDARNFESKDTIHEFLVSCEARALEVKGDFDAAAQVYERALQRPHSILTLMNYANFQASRGFMKEAKELYMAALYKDSSSDTAYMGMGLVRESLGEYPQALRAYRKAIELSPGSPTAYSTLANFYINQKNSYMAMQAARKAVELDPASADAHNTLGYVLYTRNMFDEASKEYELAVTISPRFITAYVNWADALLNQKKYDEAIAKTQKALELNPKSVLAHTEMALILLNKNDHFGAIRECETAANYDNRFVAAYANWISALLNLKRHEEAEQKAREIAERTPESADAQNNLGYVLMVRGRYDEAIKQFEKAADLNRFNTYIYINWAETLMNQRRYAEAAQKAQEAIGQDPASADAYNVLGYVLRQSGAVDGALQQHEQAMKVNPFNVYSYTGAAEALLAKRPASENDLSRAVEYAKKAIEKDPYSAPAHNELGWVLQKSRKFKDAIAAHNAALKLDPYYVYTYTTLVDLYLNESSGFKDTQKALNMARKAIEIDPASADAHGSLGWAQMSNSKYDEAVAAFAKAVALNPFDGMLRVGLAGALRAKSNYQEAELQAREARRLDPGYTEGCAELNQILSETKKPTEPCG